MIYIILSVILVIADQLTKLATVEYLMPVKSITLIEGILSLTYVENKGAAFGVMQNARWFFIIFTIAVIAAVIIYTIMTKQRDKTFLISVSLICSGGLGNLIDRIFRGYVVDMIEVTFIEYPVFNFADICVVCGAILLCIFVLFSKDVKK